ncbi:hypothetical protein SteCoe_17611 [Stentor coeruleus]|uniref:Uncharacterized protein n=1 Tax=Stentor coeruleus TaxID=5963 RepID=A0A1R2BYH5_9CILI|nr:hypothetical protein SteCoe_17611 [Stentor coeruleus]
MPRSEQQYNHIPYQMREYLCELLNITISLEKIKNFITTNLPEDDHSPEMINLKSNHLSLPVFNSTILHNFQLYSLIGKQLVDEFEEHKHDRKPHETIKYPSNYEQFKKRAMALKVEQIIQIKDVSFCSGLGFYLTLDALARQECYKISIPDSIIVGFGQISPTKLWTDKHGILKSTSLQWENLQHEIEILNNIDNSPIYPVSVLKYECYNDEGIKVRSEVILFRAYESQEIYWKIHNLSYGNNYIIVQDYIRPKTGTASKIRVQFTNKIEKVYRIHNRKVIKQKKEEIDEKMQSFENRHGRENSFTAGSNIIKLNLTENSEFIEKSVQICNFFIEIADCLGNEEIQKFAKAVEFFEKKKSKLLKKLEILDGKYIRRHPTGLVVSQEERTKMFNNFTARLTNSFPDVYLVTNTASLDPILTLIKVLMKASKVILPKTQKITELIIDVTEDTKGNHYLLKVQKVSIEEKGISSIPKWKEFRHISLFSATEGSSVAKGKRQQLCCGDYCNLLKRNDLKTSEKIELFIKAKPEYSSVLYKLLRIQNFLNLDSAQTLFNNGNRAGSPLTHNMQYKTVRRIILEDRNDPNSLKSVISALPEEILQELSISTVKCTDSKPHGLHNLNKKLSWEYELVPVCSMCYKIYNLKDSQTQTPSVVKEKNIIENKFWKIDELRYKCKSSPKLPGFFVNYDKMLQKLQGSVSNIKVIREKLMKSNFVTNKVNLISTTPSLCSTPKNKSFAFTNKISSSIINGVCEKFEEFRESLKKQKNGLGQKVV